MKRAAEFRFLSFALASLLTFLQCIPPAAAAEYIAFKKTYTRVASEPVPVADDFSVLSPEAGWTLRVINGAGSGERVSSAVVNLNGKGLLKQNEFNQKVAHIEKAVPLQAANALDVTLNSKPGAALTLEVFADDPAAPVIAITSPQADALFNTAEVPVAFALSDDLSGLDPQSLRVLLDGQDVTADFAFAAPVLENSASGTLNLPDGTHTLSIAVSDLAGQGSSAAVDFMVDLTPPVFSALQPAPGATLSNPRPVISAAFSDALSGVDPSSVGLRLDGADVTAAANITGGSINYTPSADLADGPHTAAFSAADLAGNSAQALTSFTITTAPPPPPDDGLPPDPETVAPPLDTTGITDFSSANAFLYSGSNPIQTGMDPETIEPERAAVLRGRVLDRTGAPLSGVTVTVLNHPEYGQTLSRADGVFDLVVNGGGLLKLAYAKEGLLPVQRQVNAPWLDYAWLPDAVMNQVDEQVTTVDLQSPEIQVARGSTSVDQDGARNPALMVMPGTEARILLPGGGTQPLSQMNVRITEYTVGDLGDEAMPGELPPSSAYTYAFEMSADEALNGAIKVSGKDVLLSQPVIYYVENFLGFPVGAPVPTGYYDNDAGVWVPSDSGRVVQILSVQDGAAVLDVEGGGEPASAAALADLGISQAELTSLSAQYSAGQSLWRVLLPHFSTWDCNWARQPDAPIFPEFTSDQVAQAPDDNPTAQAVCGSGSVIECQNQVLHESIAIAGTGQTLNYSSERVRGRRSKYALDIPISGPSVPAPLKRIVAAVSIAGGPPVAETFAPLSNQVWHFEWDGLDAYGREVNGRRTARITIGNVYDGRYILSDTFGEVLGTVSDVISRDEAVLSTDMNVEVGNWDTRELALGAWSLSDLHQYDPYGRMLHLGTGPSRDARNLSPFELNKVPGSWSEVLGQATAPDGSVYVVNAGTDQVFRVDRDDTVTLIAGTGVRGHGSDGVPATESMLDYPQDVFVGPDGAVYIAEYGIWGPARVRRVDANGIISTVAGGHNDCVWPDYRDGGPATQACLSLPFSIAVGADNSLTIGEVSTIRRVDQRGIISRITGMPGDTGFSGDGGPASAAKVFGVSGMAFATDGSLYFTDTFNHRVRRIALDGTISTVAGTGNADYNGEGLPALQVNLNRPMGIAFAPDGSYYITDGTVVNSYIRWVGPDGILVNIAGGGNEFQDGIIPTQARLLSTSDVAVTPEGSLLSGHRTLGLFRISSSLPRYTGTGTALASEDGSELYVFDGLGRHLRTVDSLTGAVLMEVLRDAEGRAIGLKDESGNVTVIERNAAGEPTAIVSPFGVRTELTVNADGYLMEVRDPAGGRHQMTYHAGGLLASFENPRGSASNFEYDNLGFLTRDEDAAGGFTALARTSLPEGVRVDRLSAEGVTQSYVTDIDWRTGEERQTNTLPDGTTRTLHLRADKSSITTQPDGTVIESSQFPDPRFGMQAPVPSLLRVTTPAGLVSTSLVRREAVLSDPNDRMSLETLTETTTVNDRVFTSTYDAATRVSTSLSPLGRQQITELDELGRVVRSETPGLTPVTFTYDGFGRPASVAQGPRANSFTYNGSGYLETVRDPLNRTVSFTYDAAGRVTRQTFPDSRYVLFGYDENGNLTSITPPSKPAHGFAYTPVDLQQQYSPPPAGLPQSATQYTYNKDRQLTSVIRPDGKTIALDYDTAGRLSTTTIARGQYSYGYDPQGRLASISSPDGEGLAYSYDGFLPLSTTWSGPVAGSVSQTYDNDFRVVSQSVNSANPISFGYDNDGLLTQAGALNLSYDAQTALLKTTSVGSVADNRTYNSFGELANQTTTVSSSNLYRNEYTRDPLGRITSKIETVQAVSHTYQYDYDLAGRLTDVRRDGVSVGHYEYDDNGNRMSATVRGETAIGIYDDQDRLLSYGGNSYTYTANGELLSKTNADGTTAYEYDELGNLIKVALPDTTVVEYVIDGLNRRIGKKVNGTLIQGFLYESQLAPVAELDASGNVVSRFIYATRVNVPDYMVKNGQTYQIVADHLGSPRLVVNTVTGQVLQAIEYDEFGNVLFDSNPGFQPFGFAGGLYDQQTKLTKFGARDYDVYAGRWTNKDPLGFMAGDVNLYSYTLNDPVNFADPAGLLSEEQCKALREVLRREQKYGTQIAAAMSGNTFRFSDRTLAPFNNQVIKRNTTTKYGELDVDWFTDIWTVHYSGATVMLYSAGKIVWSARRTLVGETVTHFWPLSDPGEVTALAGVLSGLGYKDFFDSAFMEAECPSGICQ